MDMCLLINDLIIIIFFILNYIHSGVKDFTMFLCFLIIYIILKMIYYLIKENNLRKIILILTLGLILYFYFSKDFKLYILLLPINIYCEFEVLKLNPKYSIYSCLFFTFFINKDIVPEYILVAGTSYIVFKCYMFYKEKVTKLLEENYNLKNYNYEIKNKLQKDIDYRKNMEYLVSIEERNKISQQIHDGIGHTLAGSIMQLEASKILMDNDMEKSKEINNNVIMVLKQGMESIRKTLRDIKPSNEEMGINQLKFFLQGTEKDTNIKTILIYDKNIEHINFMQWKVILDNIKECITNTLKYGKASKIKVEIQLLNKIIKVKVTDDGKGSFSIKKGLGIIGMEERAANLNGKIIIDGSDGFSVIMLLPLKGDLNES